MDCSQGVATNYHTMITLELDKDAKCCGSHVMIMLPPPRRVEHIVDGPRAESGASRICPACNTMALWMPRAAKDIVLRPWGTQGLISDGHRNLVGQIPMVIGIWWARFRWS